MLIKYDCRKCENSVTAVIPNDDKRNIVFLKALQNNGMCIACWKEYENKVRRIGK